MFDLMIKDFAIQRKNFLGYLLIGLVFMIYFSTYQGGVAIGLIIGCVMITNGFINRVFYEDEKQNAIRLLLALPIKKQTLVVSRYLSIIIVFVGTVVLYFGLHQFLSSLGLINQLSSNVKLISIFLVILVFGVQLAFYLPMIYQFGYIRALGINRFLWIGFGVFISLLGTLFTKMGNTRPPAWIYELGKFLKEFNPRNGWWLVIAIFLSLYVLSLLGSIRLFERKSMI